MLVQHFRITNGYVGMIKCNNNYMQHKENELSVSRAASVTIINTSKYLSGLNRTERICLIYSGRIRLEC